MVFVFVLLLSLMFSMVWSYLMMAVVFEDQPVLGLIACAVGGFIIGYSGMSIALTTGVVK